MSDVALMMLAYNVSDVNMTNSNLSEGGYTPVSTSEALYVQPRWIMSQVIGPTLCAFGITGNILNVIVLSRRQMQASIDNKMERTACLGLIVLAVSDMLYCVFTIPEAFSKARVLYTSKSFWLYYSLYGSFLRNMMSYTSTWLTVLMALSRYMAICHPLHARIFVNPAGTKLSILLTIIFWACLTMPEAWSLYYTPLTEGNTTYIILEHGPFTTNTVLRNTFTYLWSILGFIIPVSILAFCNARLIQALRESQRMRREYRVHQRTTRPGSKITPTLIAIVIMFIILVTPSEILNIVRFSLHYELLLAVSITNVMHTLNFSMNFILYCVVNVHFRSTLRDVFCGVCKKEEKEARYLQSTATMYSHVPTRSAVSQQNTETTL